MLRLRSLLVAAVTILALVGWVESDTMYIPNPTLELMDASKFVTREGPVLGLDTLKLGDALGVPHEIGKGDCSIPLLMTNDLPPVPVIGDAWLYKIKTNTGHLKLIVCVLNNYAVAEQRSLDSVDGSIVFMSQQTLVDLDLVKEVFNGELDRSAPEESSSVDENGYEI